MIRLSHSVVLFLGGLLLVLALVSAPSYAQQTLGAISGTVTDISGATVAGANVTIHNVATNFEESTNSHADGAFSFFDLPIGGTIPPEPLVLARIHL